MSNHDNARRGEKKRSEHGARYERLEPNRHVAKARAKWKKLQYRNERRTGQTSPKIRMKSVGKPMKKVKDG